MVDDLPDLFQRDPIFRGNFLAGHRDIKEVQIPEFFLEFLQFLSFQPNTLILQLVMGLHSLLNRPRPRSQRFYHQHSTTL